MSARGCLLSRESRRAAQLVVALSAAAGVVTSGARVSATLAEDVTQLRASWARTATRVEELQPRLLGRGERIPIALPGWVRDVEAPCITLAVLGTPSSSFAVYEADREHLSDPEISRVGWVQVSRCGAERASRAPLYLEMRSPRGLLQLLVGGADQVLPSPGRLLAHRDPGPSAENVNIGMPPVPAPADVRSAAWERRAKSEGATRVARRSLVATGTRVPGVRLEVAPGCHRFAALAASGVDRRRAESRDLDLFVQSESQPGVLRQDQSENSDAELELCVGALEPLRLGIAGLVPGDSAVLEHAEFPLPSGLPERWGAEARARIAEAFFRRNFRGRSSGPVYESLGIVGRTTLPLSLEPRTCYVAAAVILEGNIRDLGLEVSLRDRDAASDSTSSDAALALAFCTGDHRDGALRVEAIGPSVVWLGALWRTGGDAPTLDMP